MIDVTTITAGSNLVSVQEAKDYLNLDADYPELVMLIKGVQEKAEAYCARSFTSRTLELRLDYLESDVLTLPRYPVTSITSVKTLDESDVETTIASSTYYLADQERLVFTTSPEVQRDFGGLLIRFVCGDSTQAPSSIKAGILKAVSTVFENREDYVIGSAVSRLPDSSKTFFDTWRTLC